MIVALLHLFLSCYVCLRRALIDSDIFYRENFNSSKAIVFVKQIMRHLGSWHFIGLCSDERTCACTCSCNEKEEIDNVGISNGRTDCLLQPKYPFHIDVGILSLSCGLLLDYMLYSVCALWYGLEWP